MAASQAPHFLLHRGEEARPSLEGSLGKGLEGQEHGHQRPFHVHRPPAPDGLLGHGALGVGPVQGIPHGHHVQVPG